jgi:CBS domain-containing protein
MRAYSEETLRDLVRPGVITIPPEFTLREVAERLSDEEVGLAVVSDQRGMVGVVSERDVINALAVAADPDVASVDDVLTPEPICVDIDDSPLFAADCMVNANVRHLPILDGGKPIGVVSMRDIVAALSDVARSA